MARALASIRTIDDIQPIKGADRIVVASLGGWLVVVGKGEFQPGEKVVYFEPDSMLPLSNPVFGKAAGYGKNRDNRKGEPCVVLRTVRLRGQISQGLAVPLDSLGIPADTPAGTDVTELLGITKYEPPEKPMGAGWAALPLPDFVWHTDETRIQNLADMLAWFNSTEGSDELAAKFTATEKIDGTSTSFFRYVGDEGEVEYGVGSHGLRLVEAEVPAGSARTPNSYWNTFERYDMRERLDALAERHPGCGNVVIQGEMFGPNIQSNRLRVPATSFLAFNVTVDSRRLDPRDEGLGDICVPRVDVALPCGYGRGVAAMADAILAQADGRRSLVTPDALAEGIVWRYDGPLPDGFSHDWAHFKSVSNSYLAKEK